MLHSNLKEFLVKAVLQRAKILLGNTMDSEFLRDRHRNPGFNIVSGWILCLGKFETHCIPLVYLSGSLQTLDYVGLKWGPRRHF